MPAAKLAWINVSGSFDIRLLRWRARCLYNCTNRGTIGYSAPPHSSLMLWRSEWHIPQYRTVKTTSLSPGALQEHIISSKIRTHGRTKNEPRGSNGTRNKEQKRDLIENSKGERWPDDSRAANPKASRDVLGRRIFPFEMSLGVSGKNPATVIVYSLGNQHC